MRSPSRYCIAFISCRLRLRTLPQEYHVIRIGHDKDSNVMGEVGKWQFSRVTLIIDCQNIARYGNLAIDNLLLEAIVLRALQFSFRFVAILFVCIFGMYSNYKNTKDFPKPVYFNCIVGGLRDVTIYPSCIVTSPSPRPSCWYGALLWKIQNGLCGFNTCIKFRPFNLASLCK